MTFLFQKSTPHCHDDVFFWGLGFI